MSAEWLTVSSATHRSPILGNCSVILHHRPIFREAHPDGRASTGRHSS